MKGTKDYGFYYNRNDKFELKVYIDVDWSSNVDEKKSTWCIFLSRKEINLLDKQEVKLHFTINNKS